MAKMIAVDHGFYKGRYIKKGETFDYPDKERPRKWMVKAAEGSAPKVAPKAPHKDAKKDPSALSDLTKQTDSQMKDSPRDGLV